jgi:hypothetical protein
MFWNVGSTLFLFALPQSERTQPSFCATTRSLSLQASGSWTAPESIEIPIQKYDKLLEWIKSKNGEINNKIEIRPSSRGGGYGAYVSESVAEGDVLFTIPRSACLTLDDATEDKDCGAALTKLIEKAGAGANTVVMAGYMAKEYLSLMEDEKNGRDLGNTKWGPYFETLPWNRGVNDQEHILFWSDDMVDSLLKGSSSYEEATGLRTEVDLAIRVMNAVVGKKIRAYRGEDVDEGFSWPWETKPPAPATPPEGFPDAVKGAFVSLLTRSFQDGDSEGDEEKLVPLLDLLQHSDTPNIRHFMRKADGTVEVRARCNLEANEELLNQYRKEEEDRMPYSRFFTRFGFVPGISEPIVALLKDKSSIFYPQTAEI